MKFKRTGSFNHSLTIPFTALRYRNIPHPVGIIGTDHAFGKGGVTLLAITSK